MKFDEALDILAEGDPVYRESWAGEDCLEPQFEADGEYTVKIGNKKVSFNIVREDQVYEVTGADKHATDWASAL